MIDLFFDIGGTNTRYRAKEKGRYIKSASAQTQNIDLLSFIEQAIKKCGSVDFIGISFAGQVFNNRIISSPNIELPDIDITLYLKEKYGVNVVVENDLKCAALAEYSTRKQSKMLASLFIGSGIGSAYIYEGKLMRGSGNTAGEIGHVYFKQSPFRCGCGKNTCVELFSSGSAIEKWFDFYKIDDKPTLDNLNKIDKLKEVKENFYKGLSLVCSIIAKIINPDFVVLGGGVLNNNPALAEFIKDKIKEFSFLKNNVIIEMSAFENSSLKGAEFLK